MSEESYWEMLQALCTLDAPSGGEKPVTNWLAEAWRPYAAQIERQGIGNLVAHVPGPGPRLLLCAHADELCFMVRYVEESGFLRVAMNHPADSKFTIGFSYVGVAARVLRDDGTAIPALFASSTGHVLTEQQRAKTEKTWDDIFLDIGARNRVEAISWGIHVGSKVVFAAAPQRLGHYVTGKALDDRGGLVALTQLLQALNPAELAYDLYVVGTVQEEPGLIGSDSICLALKPDYAIAIDIGLAGDVPTTSFAHMPVRLGDGPTLVYRDGMAIYDEEMIGVLARLADEGHIPVQRALFYTYGSDAIACLRSGVRAALVAFPTRYTHTPFETASLADMRALTSLLQRFVTTPPEAW